MSLHLWFSSAGVNLRNNSKSADSFIEPAEVNATLSLSINSAPVAVMTTAEFHAAVMELKPTVAVFDCDGTLWSEDAGTGFMHWSVETGLLSRAAADLLDARYRAYKRGEVSEVAICGEMVQIYHGLSESELRQSAARFFAERVERNIFPEMLSLVGDLLEQGVEIWAVSSTNSWVIEEAVTRFGILKERVLSARVAVEDGMVTDRLIDVPTDEGKVAALLAAGVTAPDAVFGNSVHDAAMLAIARQSFPVNPSSALLERSTIEGWRVYFPAAVTPKQSSI